MMVVYSYNRVAGKFTRVVKKKKYMPATRKIAVLQMILLALRELVTKNYTVPLEISRTAILRLARQYGKSADIKTWEFNAVLDKSIKELFNDRCNFQT